MKFIKDALSGLRQFLAIESSLTMMKNAFNFKFLFSRYLNYCYEFFIMLKNSLISKTRLIEHLWCHNLVNKQLQNIYWPISQEVKATNISRSKGNQEMKFSRLIEYNMSNIFLKKSNKKCGGNTIPRSKKSKLSKPLDQ